MPGICWLSLDRTRMSRIMTVQDGASGQHSERQRPLRNARASDGQKRHRSVARAARHSRVTVDLKIGLGSTY